LVPANSYNYANLGRVLADQVREGVATPAETFTAFEHALALDPNNAYFYADAANAALLLGDLERARQYAARGAALYPRFALLQAQLGHLAMLRQRPAEAAPLLQAALAGEWHGAERARGSAATNLAAAWLQLGKPAQAEAAARLAVTLSPTAVEPRFNLAKALELQGRRAEAVEEYRRLLAQQPGYEPARAALRALGAS
ncbi:MAG TPA: tetratricopeptide repeat protein, partial [Methylomirabilota bacterium]|nr:tetratricopeptide repeat protein [Methylomirabilota bacterium]